MRYEERTLKEYAIICTRCGDRGPWAFSKQKARELAEEYGWRLDGPLCPECQEREEREGYDLFWDSLVREAYEYAKSFPVEHWVSGTVVKGPAEVDGLPPTSSTSGIWPGTGRRITTFPMAWRFTRSGGRSGPFSPPCA